MEAKKATVQESCAQSPASPTKHSPPTETTRGGVLALLRQAAERHDPATCLHPHGSPGPEGLCASCRLALERRLLLLSWHLGLSEARLWLLCALRGLQQIAGDLPLPTHLRATLLPFGAPALASEARFAFAVGHGLAADLSVEEAARQTALLDALEAEMTRRERTRAAKAADGVSAEDGHG